MTAEVRLSPFQDEVLREVFARDRRFFLTGGAALVGYYFHHRHTDDLDLFTVDDAAFTASNRLLGDVAHALGARLEIRVDSPSFRRAALTRGDDVVVVDTVLDRVPQLHPDKPVLGGVSVDPADEILVNKLTAIVERLEERDIVDVLFFERAGYRVEDALAGALAKDGGCTAATLAHLLSEVHVPDDARLPAGVPPAELRAFVADLIRRLTHAALPEHARSR